MVFFKNHFGMVISVLIALILSVCMSSTAIIWNHLEFNIDLLVRNWGTAFLTIIITSIIFQGKMWGDMFAGFIKLKPMTFPFGLVSNLIPTFFYNTAATLVLAGVNLDFRFPAGDIRHIFGGFAAPFYWQAVLHDYFMLYLVSYILSLIAEAIALKLAFKWQIPAPHVYVFRRI
jgi:hypothetical protein